MDWIFNRFWRRRWTCVHFLLRFWINFVVTFGYYGFWRCTLDIFGWSSRPFNPQRLIGLAKVHQTEHTFYIRAIHFIFFLEHQVLHNMFYSFLGVIQYTAWEAIFLHCYATGRLPFLNNQQVVSSFSNIAIFVLSFFFVPLFRGVHFYFSHRWFQLLFAWKADDIGKDVHTVTPALPGSSTSAPCTSTSTQSTIATLTSNHLLGWACIPLRFSTF